MVHHRPLRLTFGGCLLFSDMTERASLRRYDHYAGPQRIGDLWTLTRGTATLRCHLSTHARGWELRLTSGANFLRSHVCRAEDEVFSTSQAWETEAKGKGWA